MVTRISGAAVVQTWSYCGGLDPVRIFHHAASARVLMLKNDCEVGTMVEMKMTGLKAPDLRQVVIAPAQMASAQLEAQKAL